MGVLIAALLSRLAHATAEDAAALPTQVEAEEREGPPAIVLVVLAAVAIAFCGGLGLGACAFLFSDKGRRNQPSESSSQVPGELCGNISPVNQMAQRVSPEEEGVGKKESMPPAPLILKSKSVYDAAEWLMDEDEEEAPPARGSAVSFAEPQALEDEPEDQSPRRLDTADSMRANDGGGKGEGQSNAAAAAGKVVATWQAATARSSQHGVGDLQTLQGGEKGHKRNGPRRDTITKLNERELNEQNQEARDKTIKALARRYHGYNGPKGRLTEYDLVEKAKRAAQLVPERPSFDAPPNPDEQFGEDVPPASRDSSRPNRKVAL